MFLVHKSGKDGDRQVGVASAVMHLYRCVVVKKALSQKRQERDKIRSSVLAWNRAAAYILSPCQNHFSFSRSCLIKAPLVGFVFVLFSPPPASLSLPSPIKACKASEAEQSVPNRRVSERGRPMFIKHGAGSRSHRSL